MATAQEILDWYAKGRPPSAGSSASSDGGSSAEDILKWYAARAKENAPEPVQFVDPATGATGGPTPGDQAPPGWSPAPPGPVMSLAERFRQNPVSDRFAGTQEAVNRLLGYSGGPSAIDVEAERQARGEAVRQGGGSLGEILAAQGPITESPFAMGFGAAPSPGGGSLAGVPIGNRLVPAPPPAPAAAPPVGVPNRLLAPPSETPMPAAPMTGTAPPVAAVTPVTPVTPVTANPLLGPPAATGAAENRLIAPPEAPPVETPTTGPKGNILPIRTQAQAEAKADEILRHFAQGGNTAIDTTEMIPGSAPTLSKAIVGGNPGIAALERRIAEDNPNAFQPNADKIAAARSSHFAETAGTKEADDVAAAQVRRRYQAEDARVFSPQNMDRADPTSVIKTIDDALAGRQGQRGAIAEALQGVRAKLVDANGKMQTDPNLLYGVRQDINDSIGPLAQGTKNDRRAAAHELIDVRNALDPVINDAAPGFGDFIKRFSEDMGPIEGRRYLRSMRLTDANGNITLGKLDQAIKTLENQRNLPGLRAGDSVTEDQLKALNTLREDFRTDNKRQLGRALGSPTVQNLGTSRALGVMTHPAVTAATTLAGGAAEPVLGLGGPILRHMFATADAKGQQMVMDALKRKLLNPQDAASAFQPPR